MTLWGKVVDHRRCIGCHACTVACKAEHEVPLGVTRTYVKQVEVGRFPNTRRHFQVTRCNQCENPPCVEICPVTAMYRRPDGIVDFDRSACIGCKACIAACPYDAIYIDPESHSAEKCNFCAHRIDQGLEPACVVVCPERAIVVGDLTDPLSEVSQLVAREKAEVRKPEKGTDPKLYYVDANDFTLVPGAAVMPGMHAASEQVEGYPLGGGPNLIAQLMMEGGYAGTRRPAGQAGATAAAAIVSYDVPHKAPWDWRVSAYTWTKSVAAGAYGLPAVLSLLGRPLPAGQELAATVVALVFLVLTGGFLVGDLSHPERFLNVLLRPQWRSWLARGAYIITAFGGVLGLDLLSRLFGVPALAAGLRAPGVLLAVFTAMYTAFLLGQARGRDLWQNPALPLHLLVQATLAGGGVLVLLGAGGPGILAAATALHLALVAGELLIPHSTRDGARSAHQMVRGAYGRFFWFGVLTGLAVLALALAPGGAAAAGAAAGLALAGLLAYEHAYIQAGQSVPLS